MQWMILQQEQAEDYVITTGIQYSVREFVQLSARELGIELEFTGTGVDEGATVARLTSDMASAVKPGQVILRYLRPPEVKTLLGCTPEATA
jgi:GDPmannose 4,6-dehydratase